MSWVATESFLSSKYPNAKSQWNIFSLFLGNMKSNEAEKGICITITYPKRRFPFCIDQAMYSK